MLRLLAVAAALLPLALSVPVSLSHAQTASTGPPPPPTPALGFDYLHLVQEWPGSFCDTKRGCKWPAVEPDPQGWLLHGLWPEFNNGSWPQYCDPSAPFNMTAIQDMLPELQKYWPSLVSPVQEAFWEHEWTRHGTCCEHLTPKEHDYFRLVLDLREKFDAHKILSGVGILPEGTTTWSAVKKGLEAVSGATVEVGCNFDASGKRQLYEIRSCYTSKGNSVMQTDCLNSADSASCGGPDTTVYYPPFQPVKATLKEIAAARVAVKAARATQH